MKLKVRVTKKDIELGVRNDSENCAIARAIKRKLPVGTYGVSVLPISRNAVFYGKKDNVKYVARLPLKAIQFIHNFDNEPFFYGCKAMTLELDLKKSENYLRTV